MSALTDLLDRFDPELPLERASTIPAQWYFHSELAELERRTVFSGWQPVARVDQLVEPGSFVTADVGGEPIVTIRDEAGKLRAFANVCRHRAAVLLTEPAGCFSKIRCRYHGWTYDLAGRLRGAPEFDGVCDFAREDNGLTPWTLEQWRPFVWVKTDPGSQTLQTLLGPLANVAFEKLQWAGRREYEVECNWKVYVDNYLDGGYHVNSVHPSLAGALDYANYRTELFGYACLQSSPMVPSDEVGSVRSGSAAQYWWVFPNFMLNLYDGVMDTNVVYPIGPDRCRVVFDFFFAGQSPDFIRQSMEVAEQVQQEDMRICADVQRGLRSRAFDTGRYSVRREGGTHLFHRLLTNRLQQAAVRM